MLESFKQIRRVILGKLRLLKFRLLFCDIKAEKGFYMAPGTYISRKHKIRIGKNVFIGRHCHIASNLEVGDNTMIASRASFLGGDHKIHGVGDIPIRYAGPDVQKTTVVEENTWIGHGAIILAGVRIKSGAVVAAGAVVTKDVESNMIVGGNYAKEIRKREV